VARIAYLDHSFHRTTRSTEFLPELLRHHGHVIDYFWDDSWRGGAPVRWSAVGGHDVVIMFQSYCQPEGVYFSIRHPNVIYIPMLDQFGGWQGPTFNLSEFWEPFQGSKVLNFSNAGHCMTTSFGIASHFVRYYPPVVDRPNPPTEGLHGFYWLRRELEMPWQLIRKLIANTRFDSFHIHLSTDPGFPPARQPSDEDIARHKITTSAWFENKADLDVLIARANIYFAPRLNEGIGQSFLEAMSRGQCVVAPNQGTMNEYIVPGLNGLLYDPRRPVALDFSNCFELGRQAKRGARYGRALWEQSEEDLLSFILAPSRDLYFNGYQHPALAVASVRGLVLADASKALYQGKCWMAMLGGMAMNFAILRSASFLWRPVKVFLARLARALH
jgi:hypothetical protein